MADCVACGTKLDEGVTKCPQCGADLRLPGSFLQAVGWVTFLASLIPIVVGFVTFQQRDFRALIVGAAMFLAGIGMVCYGRMRNRTAPQPTKPSAAPAGPGFTTPGAPATR